MRRIRSVLTSCRLGGGASLLALLLAIGWPSVALAQAVRDPGLRVEAAASLRPGQHVWLDDGTPVDGTLSMLVSLTSQRIFVYRDTRLIGMAAVSTGMAGHATPVGAFQILQKNQWHRSNLYSNAPMPYMQRLTWDGIAIHAGIDPGYPASHGCIRVPMAFARKLFAATLPGVTVYVAGEGEGMPEPEAVPPLRYAALGIDDAITGAGEGGGSRRSVRVVQAIRLEYSPLVFRD